MVYSMTGFGRSEYSDEARKIIIEIKSVNHRYSDISVKMPRSISRFEPEIRKRMKNYVERGKVDIFITYSSLQSSGYTVKYDKGVAEQYMKHFKSMEEDFGLEEDYKPTIIARFPDVLTVEENYYVEDEEYAIIEKVLDEAGTQFKESRAREGANLTKDLLEKMDELEALVLKVEELAPKMVEIYADKVAVDEEVVRLHSHIDAIRDMLKAEESSDSDLSTANENKSIGRRLDFIIQEMNREANTTLSKSDTLAITDIGIDMKTCIEKVREQVQNLE